MALTKPHQRKSEEKEKVLEEGEIRSSLLIQHLKDRNLSHLGKEEEGKSFHKLHVLGMNDDLWDRVCGVGSETWKGCE